MILHPQGITPTAIEPTVGDSTKVTNAGQGRTNKAKQKIIHDLSAKGHFAANLLMQSQVKVGNTLFRFGLNRLLSRNHCQIMHRILQSHFDIGQGTDRAV